jgi:hypothetical protein
VWSILKPRDAVFCEAPPDITPNKREALFQDCVTVNYIVAGNIPGFDRPATIGIAEGLWTLEVPDHALGRAVERSRFLHPGTIIREAHVNLLGLPSAAVSNERVFDDDTLGFLIKAGPGCFVGHFHVNPDVSTGGEFSARVRVKTWLADDQLRDEQIPLCEKGEAGSCLGDGWLRPHPPRRIEKHGPNQVAVRVWQPLRGGAA